MHTYILPPHLLLSHPPFSTPFHFSQGAALAIWTTTPWTIPANLAIAVNAQLEYAVVEAMVR